MSNFSFWDRMMPATKHLLLITVLCYVGQLVCGFAGVRLENALGLHYVGAEHFNLLQTVTYMFMHGNFSHLFFNMFALWMFGTAAEQGLGTKKFIIYYFVCGIGAALIQELVWMASLHGTIEQLDIAIAAGDVNAMAFKSQILDRLITIGASGAVFGLLLAYGWLFPEASVMFIFLPIPIPSRIFVAIYAVVELFAGVANFSFDNVAHYAHLGGMIFGALLLFFWKKRREI
ncbi:MAG TPA: rhomboid family intramembrane serine protease [Bacteroidales bacterium]|nr:rhomboid family intramembrane serine protease [Bacteroidales bacterium]